MGAGVSSSVAAMLLFSASCSVFAVEYTERSGKELYQRFCASCHGVQGRGDGPVAASFEVEMPDLTLLARRNRGTFPRQRVERIIDGRHILGAHGTRLMPVWGQDFSRVAPADADAERSTHSLIAKLTEHLATLQRPPPP